MSKFFNLALLGFVAIAVWSQPARAGIVVGTCMTGTQYQTVQDAVNAAAPTSTINICPGYYSEQVVISKPVTLQGVAHSVYDAPVIAPPTSGLVQNDQSFAAQVLVVDTPGVKLTNLTIDGLNNQLASCGGLSVAGVLFHNASGTVAKVAFRNQAIPNAPKGCDNSRGLMAIVDPPITASLTVQNSTFRAFGREGIYAGQTGLTVNIANNYVAGEEASHHSGNGIDVYSGVTGTITGNTVVNENWIDNVYPDFNGAAWGILVDCSSGVTVSGNIVTDTQGGIVVLCSSSTGNVITGNKVFNTKGYDGIYIAGNNNVVQKNTIAGSGQAGVHIDGSAGGGMNDLVSQNTITEACAGILSSPGLTNTLTPNTYTGVFITLFENTGCGPLF